MTTSFILGALACMHMACDVGADIGLQWHDGIWMRALNIAATIGWVFTAINLLVAAYKAIVA